jgi:hypothetical protein
MHAATVHVFELIIFESIKPNFCSSITNIYLKIMNKKNTQITIFKLNY